MNRKRTRGIRSADLVDAKLRRRAHAPVHIKARIHSILSVEVACSSDNSRSIHDRCRDKTGEFCPPIVAPRSGTKTKALHHNNLQPLAPQTPRHNSRRDPAFSASRLQFWFCGPRADGQNWLSLAPPPLLLEVYKPQLHKLRPAANCLLYPSVQVDIVHKRSPTHLHSLFQPGGAGPQAAACHSAACPGPTPPL
jgi:hypothetical protein